MTNFDAAIAQHNKCISIIEMIETTTKRLSESKRNFERMEALDPNKVWYSFPFYNRNENLEDIARHEAVIARLSQYYSNQFLKTSI